jgi:hypothetical protein
MTNGNSSHWPEGQGGLRLSFAKPETPKTPDTEPETPRRWPAEEAHVLPYALITVDGEALDEVIPSAGAGPLGGGA